jgi:hypothetical protein
MKLLRTSTLLTTLDKPAGFKNPTRRQLLKALGITPLAHSLLPRLDAFAQGAVPSTPRLLLLFSSSGVVPEQWYPTGTETAWTFPAGGITEPLTKHKDGMIFFSGLERGAAGGGGHEASTGGVWTGNSCKSSVAQAPSVDQVIAKNTPKRTDFASFPFGAMCFYAGEGDITSKIKNNNPYIIHAGAAQKIASECDPYKVYDKLFAGVNMGGPADAMGGQAAMDKLRAQKRSILDALKGDFADLETKVATSDKMKIGAHLESLREIERRLSSDGPKMIGAVPRPDGGIALDRNANYPAIIAIQTKLTVAALAADRTRIASLQFSRGFSQIKHSWVGHKEAHHTTSHKANEKVILGKIQRWYCERYSELFDQMKAVKDGNGTLLDNTICAYSNELALGWTHGVNPGATWWMTGAQGRAAGKLKSVGRNFNGTGAWDYNQMLQTLCNIMGAGSVTKVGDFGKPGVISPLLA